MRDECLNLIGTKIEVKVEDKNLTENLKIWRKERNISKADYLVFVGNILEELLEPVFEKIFIPKIKQDILNEYFQFGEINENEAVDAIQDIQVFCINETELMGYDDAKTDNEVFKHINCRKQDPIQKEQWEKFRPYGKWQKDKNQDPNEIYEPDYASCKCSK